MKRTNSMAEMSVDSEDDAHVHHHHHQLKKKKNISVVVVVSRAVACGSDGFNSQRFLTPTPTHTRRRSSDFMETPLFLRTCGLCRRRLVPGRDIYMYRGDNAFCSLECRQHQMIQDEREEKYSIFATKNEFVASASSSSSGTAM